ncbi:MAG: ketoacyl-ACP synthase III [bacterium]|nr:ketoacyl-ACP synthase III [bacterium]
MPAAAVLGTGAALPERVVSNRELLARLGTTDEWIVARTGIRTRRRAAAGEATSDLARAAAAAALYDAGVAASSVDLIVVATATGDHPMPSTACLLQAALGAERAAAFDLNAACSGFVYGLALADQAIAAGTARRVLLVGADTLAHLVDPDDRDTAVLFGDGAGAVVLGRGGGVRAVHLGADGRGAMDLVVPAGGSRRPVDAAALLERAHTMRMHGRDVFRGAVRAMSDGLAVALHQAGCRPRDLRLVIAHQANVRILRAVAERLDLPLEAFWNDLAELGNTGAASIPIALARAAAAGALRDGDLVGLTAAGAGLTWGAAVLRWGVDG